MKILRTALYATAAWWGGCSVAIALFPGTVLHTWFHQPLYPDYAYVRVAGIMGVGLSMMLVLVAQKIEEVWWWSWAFVMVAFGLAALGAINAVWGLPYGASSGLWWLFAGSNTVITGALLIGLQAGTNEKPFV